MGKSKKAYSQEGEQGENKRRLSSDGSTPKPDAKSSKHNASDSVCVTTDRNATDSSVNEVNKTHIAEPPPAHSNTASFSSKPPWVDQLFRRIGDIDIKLSKIDKISADLESVILSTDLLQKRVNSLESQSGKLGNTMGDLRRTQARLCDESDKSKLRSDQLQKQVMDLNSKIVDLQSRSMRENLLFFGLAEHRGQGRENCVNLIENFCETELGIEGIGDSIERAHRIGKFNGSASSRPVVVKFASFRDRERIRMSATKLKNTRFSIREQFPREVVERRKVLYPVMKRALQEKKGSLWSLTNCTLTGVCTRRSWMKESDRSKGGGSEF